MAAIEFQTAESKKTKRKQHHSLRIDMTPMVDLGFLLITFFIFTTTMSEHKAMKLFMPNDKGLSTVAESKVLTILLGKSNKVFAKSGRFEEALKENRIISSSYNESTGIGDLIRQKQKQLQLANEKEGRNNMVLLVKPTVHCSYKNLVDALDEALINGVKKYMVVNASAEEESALAKLRY